MTILILFLAGMITMCYCIPKYIFAIILKKDIPNADLTTQTKNVQISIWLLINVTKEVRLRQLKAYLLLKSQELSPLSTLIYVAQFKGRLAYTESVI